MSLPAPPSRRTAATSSAGRTTAVAAALDVAAVLVFVVVGRRSHTEGLSVAGVAETAWPFLVGLAVGWAASAVARAPLGLRTGTVVWLSAVVVGLFLRSASGGGAPTSFAVVTAVVLGVLLLGWRLLARRVLRRSSAHEVTAVPTR